MANSGGDRRLASSGGGQIAADRRIVGHQAQADGETGGFNPTGYAHLGQDASNVDGDRAFADVQTFSNLTVGPALGEDEQDFALAWRQAKAGRGDRRGVSRQALGDSPAGRGRWLWRGA